MPTEPIDENRLQLVLNDGTVIEGGRAGYADGFLWCYFSGYTMPEAAAMFFDSTKTAVILFQYGEMEDEYDGFTVCRTITTDSDGNISVCMTKE